MRPITDDGTPRPGDVYVYEIWAQRDSADAPVNGWVELYRDRDTIPQIIPHDVFGTVASSIESHFGARHRFNVMAVDVSDGELAVSLDKQWPFSAVGALLATTIAVVLAVGLAVRSLRQASMYRRIAQHEMASREAERTRVAREIHDGPLQDIAALARTGDQAAGPLREVASELRALAAGLRPPALEEFGLGAALEDLSERHASATSPLQVRVTVPEARRFPPDVELALYRVTQEALTNAVTHGRARTAWVFVTGTGSAAELVVRDDGTGLPDGVAGDQATTRGLAGAGHFGLAGMNERARALGGSLSVSPGPGGIGTEVTLRVPTDAARPASLKPVTS